MPNIQKPPLDSYSFKLNHADVWKYRNKRTIRTVNGLLLSVAKSFPKFYFYFIWNNKQFYDMCYISENTYRRNYPTNNLIIHVLQNKS